MSTNCLKQVAAAFAGLAFATAACAQYIWLDEKGVKQYSDMAPPASVPQNRILKQPAPAPKGQAPAPAAAAANKDSKPEGSKAGSTVPMTTAEKNADFNKRRMEQAEKDKKAEEQAKAAADKAKNCERARTYNQSLARGERVFRSNESGGREYMTDEQRTQEMADSKRILDECN